MIPPSSSPPLWSHPGLVVHVQVPDQLPGHCHCDHTDAQQNLGRHPALLRPCPVAPQTGLPTQHHAGQVVGSVQPFLALLHRNESRKGHLRDYRVVEA